MSFSITDIEGYIQANENQLIGKAVVGDKVSAMLNLQTGVKGSAKLNLLTATTGLQDGSACGWTKAGDVTVSTREITTKLLKVNQEFCELDLVGTSFQWGVKIAADLESIPFEQMFIDQIVKGVNKEVGATKWVGNTSDTGATYQLFDGFLTILTGGTVDGSVNSATTLANYPMTVINNVVQKIPDEIIDRSDLVVFVGYDIYRKYIAELQAANLFHYTAEFNGANMTIMIPGTNIKLVGDAGLNGTNKAFATYLENMYLGTDLENAQEKFKFWFDSSNDIFKLKILFNLGVQVAYPDLVVIAE